MSAITTRLCAPGDMPLATLVDEMRRDAAHQAARNGLQLDARPVRIVGTTDPDQVPGVAWERLEYGCWYWVGTWNAEQ